MKINKIHIELPNNDSFIGGGDRDIDMFTEDGIYITCLDTLVARYKDGQLDYQYFSRVEDEYNALIPKGKYEVYKSLEHLLAVETLL